MLIQTVSVLMTLPSLPNFSQVIELCESLAKKQSQNHRNKFKMVKPLAPIGLWAACWHIAPLHYGSSSPSSWTFPNPAPTDSSTSLPVVTQLSYQSKSKNTKKKKKDGDANLK